MIKTLYKSKNQANPTTHNRTCQTSVTSNKKTWASHKSHLPTNNSSGNNSLLTTKIICLKMLVKNLKILILYRHRKKKKIKMKMDKLRGYQVKTKMTSMISMMSSHKKWMSHLYLKTGSINLNNSKKCKFIPQIIQSLQITQQLTNQLNPKSSISLTTLTTSSNLNQ